MDVITQRLDVSAIARRRLATLPTPLLRARHLGLVLGHGPLWLKRDDLTGFGVAGNKARPLEFLVGDALAQRADVLVVAGAPSSNFIAAAALAARVAGLACEVILPVSELDETSVPMALARAAGADLVLGRVTRREDLDRAVRERTEELRRRGHTPYAVPRGGATGTGAVGFALAAVELAIQCAAARIESATIVVPTGSGGTQAGLLTGILALDLPWRLVGASVSRPLPEATNQVLEIARDCARILDTRAPSAEDVELTDLREGGFDVPSEADRVSADLMADTEGIHLDGHYGTRAMTLGRRLLADGLDGPLVIWLTGGLPTIFGNLRQWPTPERATPGAVPDDTSDDAPDDRSDP